MHYLYLEPSNSVVDIVINSGLKDVAFYGVRTRIQVSLERSEQSDAS